MLIFDDVGELLIYWRSSLNYQKDPQIWNEEPINLGTLEMLNIEWGNFKKWKVTQNNRSKVLLGEIKKIKAYSNYNEALLKHSANRYKLIL